MTTNYSSNISPRMPRCQVCINSRATGGDSHDTVFCKIRNTALPELPFILCRYYRFFQKDSEHFANNMHCFEHTLSPHMNSNDCLYTYYPDIFPPKALKLLPASR